MVINEMSDWRAVLVMWSPLRRLLQASCARFLHFSHNADGPVVVKAASVLGFLIATLSHLSIGLLQCQTYPLACYTVRLVHWLATVSDVSIGLLQCQTYPLACYCQTYPLACYTVRLIHWLATLSDLSTGLLHCQTYPLSCYTVRLKVFNPLTF